MSTRTPAPVPAIMQSIAADIQRRSIGNDVVALERTTYAAVVRVDADRPFNMPVPAIHVGRYRRKGA